jgi:uncharacterized membrane protein
MELIFPKRTTKSQSKENLELLERVALSVGVSMALVPMIGLLLSYVPGGIFLTSIMLSIVLVIVFLDLVVLVRDYRNMQSTKNMV